MKVFVLVENPFQLENPYIATLINGVASLTNEIEWGYGIRNFWSDMIYSYDIIHVHWPDMVLGGVNRTNLKDELAEKIKCIKDNGTKIVVTCHNLKPHYTDDQLITDVYSLFFDSADAFVHLGNYSCKLLKEQYPKAKHSVICHHTYEELYVRKNRKDCLNYLHLDSSKKYILCFGAFRDDEERDIVDTVLKEYINKGVEVIAPNYYKIVKRRNCLLMLKQWIKVKIKNLLTPGLHVKGWHVTDDELPYYYGVSCVSLIQRKRILNSGNLPMGFYMGNVVVGPDIGNVGEILHSTGNPVFKIDDKESLLNAIDEALRLSDSGKGKDNMQYAEEHYATSVISQKLVDLYKSI